MCGLQSQTKTKRMTLSTHVARCVVWDHTSLNSPLLFISYVPCYHFVLDRYFPRSVLVRYTVYSPSPGLGQASKYTRSFPVFVFGCPLPLASSATSVTNSQPCHWGHAGLTFSPRGRHLVLIFILFFRTRARTLSPLHTTVIRIDHCV